MPQPSRSRKRAQIIHQGSGKKAKHTPAAAAVTSPAAGAPVAADVTHAMLAGVAKNDVPSSADSSSADSMNIDPDMVLPVSDEASQEVEKLLNEATDGTAPDETELLAEPPDIAEGKKHKGKKHKKEKVVRDSFTMPRSDYEKIDGLKKKIQQLGLSAKKSEVLRAGLHALEQLTPEQLKQVIEGVEKIKTGRPG